MAETPGSPPGLQISQAQRDALAIEVGLLSDAVNAGDAHLIGVRARQISRMVSELQTLDELQTKYGG